MEELKSQIKGFDINTPPPRDIIDLARAIRQQESSGGKFNVGDHGTSKGSFMFQKGTWEDYSKKVLGKVVPMTPVTEKIVATGILYDRVYNKGYDLKRAAASWNAPAPAASNTWQNWKGVSERNGKKIAYDTPGYVEKVMAHYGNFSKEPTPVTPQAPVEPKYGFNQETESEQMSRLQSQKQLSDQADITERQGREGVVENVIGGVKDFAKGVENSATRMGGNILTFGNEAIQKAGFKGSENPILNYGTEANKFATGDATAGNNWIQKAGGLTGDVAQVVAPVPGAGKVTAALKGTDIMRKLAGMGGAGANIGSKAVGFGARALPVALEGSAAGAQADILTTGNVGLGSTLGYGALNVGANKILSALGRKTGLTQDISSQVNKAIDEGDFEVMQKLRETPAMKNYLFSQGLSTDEAILKKANEEVANLRGVLQQHNSPNKAVELNAIDDDGMKTFLRFHSPASKDINGKSSYFKTLQNLNNEESKIVSELGKIKKLISETDDLAINSVENVEIIRQSALNMAKSRLKGNMATNPTTAKATLEMINNEIDTLLQMTKGKPRFDDFDTLRIAGNKNALGSDLAAQILADAVRTRTDEIVKSLNTKGLNKAEKKAIEYFKNLNRAYGDIQKAKQIVDGFKGVPPETANRLTTLFGATLATGGTYNPFAFVTGAFLSDKIAQAFNRASALSRTPNIGVRMSTGVKTKGDEVMNFLKKESTISKNKKNTRIGKEDKMLELKDPRSLRDILLNTPR